MNNELAFEGGRWVVEAEFPNISSSMISVDISRSRLDHLRLSVQDKRSATFVVSTETIVKHILLPI